MSKPSHLFVYGTLRNDPRNEAHALLRRYGRLLGHAVFNGKLYLVHEFPGAVPSEDPRDSVHGEVYELQDESVVLPQLDEYEECSGRYAEPTLFRREKRSIRLDTGSSLPAWVYLYNRSVAALPPIPGGDFVRYRRQQSGHSIGHRG